MLVSTQFTLIEGRWRERGDGAADVKRSGVNLPNDEAIRRHRYALCAESLKVCASRGRHEAFAMSDPDRDHATVAKIDGLVLNYLRWRRVVVDVARDALRVLESDAIDAPLIRHAIEE